MSRTAFRYRIGQGRPYDENTNQGKDMRDTVELLEAIGRDATLRRA